MNVAAGEFVLGYGSLVAERHGVAAVLHGWRRCWGVAMDNAVDLPGYKSYRLRPDGSRPAVFVAFLDIERDRRSALTGVCTPVDAAVLRRLDARERNYDRIDITDEVDDAPGRVWAYRGSQAGRARLRDARADGRAVVTCDYLRTVLSAIAAVAPGELDRVRRLRGQSGLAVLDLERVELA